MPPTRNSFSRWICIILLSSSVLRLDEHTQAETVVFARAMRDLIRPLVPVAMECLEKYTLNSITLSADEIEAIRMGRRSLLGRSQNRRNVTM